VESGQTRKLVLYIAAISFAVELLISAIWLRLARGSSIGEILLNPVGLGPSLAAGVLLGLAVALASRAFFSGLAPDLVREVFVPIFGSLRHRDLPVLSLLPGLGEELLFRGVIQPEIGLAATSIIFGLLHSGFNRQLLRYGLWAALIGALLGSLYLWTGNLWGSIAAHAITNGLGILWLKRL